MLKISIIFTSVKIIKLKNQQMQLPKNTKKVNLRGTIYSVGDRILIDLNSDKLLSLGFQPTKIYEKIQDHNQEDFCDVTIHEFRNDGAEVRFGSNKRLLLPYKLLVTAKFYSNSK